MADDLEIPDDREYQLLLEDKRHKELKAVLEQLLAAMSEKKNSTDVVEAISNNTKVIAQFVSAVKDIKIDNNVSIDQEAVVHSIAQMTETINANLIALKAAQATPKPIEFQGKKEWLFNVTRDYSGFIQQITAKEK